MLFYQTLCYLSFKDFSEINTSMTIGSTSGFHYADFHYMIWHQKASHADEAIYHSITQYVSIWVLISIAMLKTLGIFLSRIYVRRTQWKFWGLVNTSHMREEFRWKLNVEKTRQFSPLRIFFKERFHFILNQSSSSWILQAKPQIHPWKEQGSLDIWSISCWRASSSHVGFLRRQQVSISCAQGFAWLLPVALSSPLLTNWSSWNPTFTTPLEHLICFSHLIVTKPWKIK